MRIGKGVWWLEMLGLLLLALVLAGVSRELNPPPQEEQLPEAFLEPAGIEAIRDVHQFGAKFIDVRPAADYARGHIPGALSWPADSSDPPPEEAFGADIIVVYDQGPDLDKAVAAGEKIKSRVRGQLMIFLEGLEGWQAAGLPLESGG